MSIGAIAEPLVVVTLLIVGTWINRATVHSTKSLPRDGSTSPSLLISQTERKWRQRKLILWHWEWEVRTPDTKRFEGRLLSRLVRRFPFLIECLYWALIYWVYQLARAATAVWIVEETIVLARHNALRLIALEQRLHIFWELSIQAFILSRPLLLITLNRIYSFIHIPGSITFLIFLFYFTHSHSSNPPLYQARRRTMALCNLLAFTIFTAWPCMPPRLLSADQTADPEGVLARSYGFLDTVHGPHGEGSIWTDNRFTNKFAAMPSLHFGYSLLIGLSILTLPMDSPGKQYILPLMNRSHPKLAPKMRLPGWQRWLCILVGIGYPGTILLAIVATANHFLLDAVAGAMVCGLAWWGNDVLLNLLVLEDWVFWGVALHKFEEGDGLLEEVRGDMEKGNMWY